MAAKPALSETRRARLERKEAAILEAARRVFVAAGFDGARMSEIARQAEVGEGTIYSYYESKAELMLAVLQQFWDGLTREAQDVMAASDTIDFFESLEALARYHLATVIRNSDFINLTFALRRTNSEVSVSRDHLRQYVAVFDRLFLRGQDRGELRADAVLWQARDTFYGTLEYSARSIEMTLDDPRPERAQKPVVEQMVALFRAHYGVDRQVPEQSGKTLTDLADKVDQLSRQIAEMNARI